MPYQSKKPCSYPGFPELVKKDSTYCERHKRQHLKQDIIRRGIPAFSGYNYMWHKLKKLYLKKKPLCAQCLAEGRVTPAEVVDHIVPHRGDYSLFWDQNNWQGLCTYHHSRKS
jgi:5-methylcytosine-specific restriction protein A